MTPVEWQMLLGGVVWLGIAGAGLVMSRLAILLLLGILATAQFMGWL